MKIIILFLLVALSLSETSAEQSQTRQVLPPKKRTLIIAIPPATGTSLVAGSRVDLFATTNVLARQVSVQEVSHWKDEVGTSHWQMTVEIPSNLVPPVAAAAGNQTLKVVISSVRSVEPNDLR